MFGSSLTQRYIPAVILLVIFIISSHFIVGKIVNDNKELAKIINISGKQRMLSQRLIILAQNYYEDPFLKPKSVFVKALNEIKSAHKYLMTKNITKKLNEIYFGKNSLDKHLQQYLKNFDNLLVLSNPIFIKLAREDSASILKQLDSAVKEYERYSTKQVKTTSKYELYILLITLMILLLEVLFIFRPAAKKIEQNTKQLIENANELLKNKEYEETVIESNNNAIIAIDWTGKITTYNQKAVEIFGWTKEEMIGTRNLLNIIPPKYKKLHQEASTKFLKTGNSCGVLGKAHELEGLRKDGTIFNIRISFGANYKIKGAIVVANIADITKEIEQNNLLIQQSKLASMGEMIGNIAHQWRQPLSVISTASTGMLMQKEYNMLTDAQFEKACVNINKNAQYLSKTIDDFRDFIKGDSKKEDFSIQVLIDKALSVVQTTLKDHFINLNIDIKQDAKIYGALNILAQVIVNIINNAKDILVEKDIDNKLIFIDVEQNGDSAIICITDNGGGVPDEIISKIFDAYFTTKHQSQGTGLGLNMAHNIVANSFHGILEVKNSTYTYENTQYTGAKFSIILPLNT